VPTLPTLTQCRLGIPSQSNKRVRKIKGILIHKEKITLSLIADDIILYLKDPKNSTQKLLNTKNSCIKMAVTDLQKSVTFLYTFNE
jgi:hypothetical protein